MESLGDIFRKFCKFVFERIFSEGNAGTYVAFVIDQSFIDEFCKTHSIKESVLMSAVRNSSIVIDGTVLDRLLQKSRRWR